MLNRPPGPELRCKLGDAGRDQPVTLPLNITEGIQLIDKDIYNCRSVDVVGAVGVGQSVQHNARMIVR